MKATRGFRDDDAPLLGTWEECRSSCTSSRVVLTAKRHASTWPARTVEERDATIDAGFKAELMGYTNGTGLVPKIVPPSGDAQVGFPLGRG